MAIKYQPKKVLAKMASSKSVKRLVTKKLTVNKAALNALETSGILGRRELERIAIKVIRQYKAQVKAARADGATKRDAIDDVTSDPRLMIQRVQNATVNEITKAIQRKYRGEFYEWIPSTAAKPDKLHMRKYGKRYRLGRGEQPGDRQGCQCGMRILVDETKLNLDDED